MKNLVSIMIMVGLLALPLVPQAGQSSEKQPKADVGDEAVTKAYTLKYVAPSEVQNVLKGYFWRLSFGEGKLITVNLPRKNVAGFEEQLRKLDVPSKTITFRIFMVIASREGRPDAIENRDLKRVLNELNALLNFKTYRLDGVALLAVKEGGDGQVQVAADPPLRCYLNDVRLAAPAGGKRSIQFRLILSQWQADKGNTLIESRTEVDENGFLVAGVSRIHNGDSLVLVINAEIK